MGFSIIPVTTAAYASLKREQLPDAAAEVNVLQRVGGSLGVALMAVILQRAITSKGPSPGPEQLADAFNVAFWWLIGFSALALPTLTMLARRERGMRVAHDLEKLASEVAGVPVEVAEVEAEQAAKAAGRLPSPDAAGRVNQLVDDEETVRPHRSAVGAVGAVAPACPARADRPDGHGG
jgi:hypothetical protein